MDRPMELLSKQLWLILHRTIISARMEPTIIVTVLRIIEREERYYTAVRLHQMHKIQTIDVDDRDVCPQVCQRVCLSRGSTRLRCAKTTEQIKRVNTVGGSKNIVLDRGLDRPPQRGGGGFDAAIVKIL